MRRITAIDFDWTPKGVSLSFTILGNTYPYSTQADGISRPSDSRYVAYLTPSNTLLTFTADIQVPADLAIVEYRWNFGDGGIGYGPSVAHTYTAASPQTAVNLLVVDSLGQTASASKILNLRPADRVTVAGNIVAVS